jgi:hypothetical protein
MDLAPDFNEFFELLTVHGVDFLIYRGALQWLRLRIG